ncbi:MAG: hypothetical protein QGD94_03600 [Planctomycetia bacterium]|nr:hypothetical protein [Planctomycetia bacterium]
MKTEVAIEGTKFLINGKPTYQGAAYRGRPVEGLLFNSRMVQAIFDDESPAGAARWRYPDTGLWDAERNTDEFCANLSEYRSHGLLAVTVGLQGGGPNFSPRVYDNYVNSAFRADGSFKDAYFDRLLRVLGAADEAGMVVIVNYFYWKQVERIRDDAVVCRITESVTDWLLGTGHRNIMVDVANESAPFWKRPLMEPANIHMLIDIVKGTSLNGRRLPATASSSGGEELSRDRWLATEDFCAPHGNGCTPEELKAKMRRLKQTREYKRQPRPILINEDSIFLENLEAAIEEECSWGFYCQGYGSDYSDRMDWTAHRREENFSELSGFQTPPVNWGINTPIKKAFFDRIKTVTGGM